MLSRIAESLYWIGRYVERAEDTSRILDVHLSLLLEDPWAPEDVVCGSLLSAMGRETTEAVGSAEVLDYLAWDFDDSASVVGAIGAARENARRSREIISTELWQSINVTWLDCTAPAPARPSACVLRLGPRTGGRVQRRRRRDDLARRRVALPDARPLDRAGRHDRPAGRVARAVGRRRPVLGDAAAELRRLPGVPAQLARRGRGPAGGRVPAARPPVPALADQRADAGRAEPGRARSQRARRANGAGAAARRIGCSA